MSACCARPGQATRIVHGFVTLDTIAIEPHFAAARQAGSVEVVELDESLLVSGLRAAGRRLPFEVTRSGLGADLLAANPQIRTITSPYDDGEELVAMPAIPLDLALRAPEPGRCTGKRASASARTPTSTTCSRAPRRRRS